MKVHAFNQIAQCFRFKRCQMWITYFSAKKNVLFLYPKIIFSSQWIYEGETYV